ncbi:TolC family protein [Oceanicola sp. S124]|uniref:TolC family protein n=1 Tax=Oceanicola sp. S124 TaxID=1042378 RepID=UPI0002559727|nr:TolC family protein [Oceanicola sp. S124]
MDAPGERSGFAGSGLACRLKLIAFCGIALLSAGGAAQAQMSLQQAVLRATQIDPGVTALRQQVLGREIDIEAEKEAWYPSIGLSGSGSSDNDGSDLTLTVTQLLYDWGLTRGKIAEATHVRAQSVAELKLEIEEVTLEVAQYFLQIESLDRKLAQTGNYMAFARRIAGQAEDRARAGVGDNGEVARARLEIARAEDQLAQIQANRSLAMSQIAFLVGEPVAGIVTPPGLSFATRYLDAGRVMTAVRLSPNYIRARAEADEAEAGIRVAKARRLPTIELEAEGRQDLNGGRSSTSVSISAGVNLSSSGFGQRQIQSAVMAAEAARNTLLATERDLTNAVSTALDQLAILQRSEISRERQLVESQKVLETYENQFSAGRRELIDLLSTGRDLYDAQIDAIETREERKKTEYQAAHDLGVLGALIVATAPGQ